MKLKKDGTPKMSGGKRENSGRKSLPVGKKKVIRTYCADLETHKKLREICRKIYKK
jgi:hypothetical protein